MIYLFIHLQNEVSHHLLHCSCVVMHRGHKKRESESDLKFTGPINKFHQHPISGQTLLQCQHIHAWCLFLLLYLSSVCLSPCHSMQLCASVQWERKRWKPTHTVQQFVWSRLSIETDLLKSPASQRVHEGDFLLSCHHHILNLYFSACCTFKECCFISRFKSRCPTWETNEVSLNEIIATAAICFLQVDVLI